MAKMLRHRKTGELMPMNGDVARHDDMVPVDVPDPKVIRITRGVAYLDEKHVFEGIDADDVPQEPPAPATKKKRAPRKKKESAVDTPVSAIDMSDEIEEAAADV